MRPELRDRIERKFGALTEYDSDNVGMAHEVFFLEFQDGREMVLKVSEDSLDFRFEREPYVLDELNGFDLPVPKIIDFEINEGNDKSSYLLMEKVEGQNINSYSEGRKFKYLSKSVKERLVKRSARKMASIHESIEYRNFGAFRAEMEKRYESEDWGTTLLQILQNNELGGIREGKFSHLYPQAKKFLEENIAELETESRPVMVHQDFSFKNMIVKKDKIRAVIDWERAISGHREIDLFKFERSIASKFRTKSIGKKYGDLLIEEYRSITDLESNWRERRNIYMFVSLLETMWTYEEWSENIPPEIREKIKKNMEKEFQNRINKEETDIFKHMD